MEQVIIPAAKSDHLPRYVELDEILGSLPISKSTWRRGVKSGRYPKPYQVSLGRKAWKLDELQQCIESFQQT